MSRSVIRMEFNQLTGQVEFELFFLWFVLRNRVLKHIIHQSTLTTDLPLERSTVIVCKLNVFFSHWRSSFEITRFVFKCV